MSTETFELPDVGEGLTEADILTWHVAVGDEVSVNQILVEVETAKAAVELPCPFDGVVAELLADEGDTVAVGSPIIAVTTAAATEGADDTASPPATDGSGGADEGSGSVLVGYGHQRHAHPAPPTPARLTRTHPPEPDHRHRRVRVAPGGR